MFFRIIFWSLVFYFALKAIKYIVRYFSIASKQNHERSVRENKNSKYKINKEDIIEAEFEDITTPKKENSKEETHQK